MYKICTLLSSFGQKMYGPKVLKILPLRFFGSFFSCVFLIIPYELFIVFVQNLMVRNESVLLPSQNGKNELLKGANTCTYTFFHNLNLIHYLSHNFQRCLGNLKLKA